MNKPTREQIENEPAGDRLSAWVAEWVMGWSKFFDELEDKHYWGVDENDSFDYYEEEWQPSTDIAAAWEVVEHLLSKHKYWVFHTMSPRGGAPEWYAGFGQPSIDTTHGDAPTAPLAICRAALLAVIGDE